MNSNSRSVKGFAFFDPEGGRIFIETDIPDKSTPKVVACENFEHIRPLQGRGKDWNEFFYKHLTTFGVKPA